jgi:hypothetical protein
MRAGNRILDALDGRDFKAFVRRLDLARFELRDVIRAPGEFITEVYFPRSCVFSSTYSSNQGAEVEIAAVGCEGFDPMLALLGTGPGAHRTVCQVAGEAYRISLAEFAECLGKYESLLVQSRRFAQGLVQFMGQSVACNRLHSLIERCARMLLAIHDRALRSEISVTREYVSVALGANLHAVEIAARALRDAGFVTYARGSIAVLDRAGLEEAACECYGATSSAYERLLGTPLATTSAETVRTTHRRRP